MLSLIKPGTRVLISQDCRAGHPATGMEGTYEGDFPRSVAFGFQPAPDSEPVFRNEELLYDVYLSDAVKVCILNGAERNEKSYEIPIREHYKEWKPPAEKPLPYFAMVMTNPRIKLDDGSIIWGDECWWGEITPGLTLEKAQADTKDMQDFIAAIAYLAGEKKEQAQND